MRKVENDPEWGSGSRENRETPSETQPFREKRLVRGCGCSRLGGDNQEKPRFQRVTTEAIDLAQAALHPVTHDSGSDAPRNNCCCTRHRVRGFGNPHAEKSPVLMTAGQSDQTVLTPGSEPRFARQTPIRRLRPGCGGRNGPRHPSGGDACGHGGGDGSGWRDHFW